MESQQIRGIWWSPEYTDVEISSDTDFHTLPEGTTAGRLDYDPTEGFNLELIGELGRLEGEVELEYIHGMTTEGITITLSNCIASNRRRPAGSGYFVTETWTGSTVFLHSHLNNGEFDSLSISFPNLENWTDLSSLEPDDEGDEYEPRKKNLIASTEDFELTLSIVEFPSPHSFSSFPDSANLVIELDTGISFSEVSNNYIHPIRNYLSLAYNESVFPTSIQSTELSNPTDIYPYYLYYSKIGEVYPNDMAFTLQDIDFGQSIQTWFSNYQDIRFLHNMFFSTVHNDDMYLELEFLSLIIGLETYHRRAYQSDNYMDELPFEAFRRAADIRLPAVPAKQRTMDLIRSIGNDYSLRDRLVSITESRRKTLDQLFDVDQTIIDARDMRHNLAHGLRPDYDSSNLLRISSRLKAICEVILLEMTGLDNEHIYDTLINRYKWHDHFEGEPPYDPWDR